MIKSRIISKEPIEGKKKEKAPVSAFAPREKTENGMTELVFILDRSGSMAGLEADTAGGFNTMLREQREKEGACKVTTVVFDHEMLTLHDRLDLKDVPALTEKDVAARGCTALVDAMAKTILHINGIQKYARPEDVPEHTLFVITTDGMENASREFDADALRAMVEKTKALYGWEFLFIGANIDSVTTAKSFGIDGDRAVDYHADAKGTAVVFGAVSRAVRAMREDAPISADWSAEIAEDFEARK